MNKEEIEEIETLEIDFKDTDELELALEVSSKKAIYLIDDLIKHLFELQQENQELKEQVDYLRRSIERKEETIIDLQNERAPYTNKYVAKLENQQKEFISYLENCINELKKESMNKLQNTINLGIVDITKEILSKYKEIIGISNENNKIIISIEKK